jgi:DNA-binding MarR family transcriptional regulator
MTKHVTRHDPRLSAWRGFLRAHARIVRELERELQDERGMALTDYDVLVQLARVEPHRLRMSELADRLLLSRSGVTRLVDRLTKDGFVERVTCDDDRRGQWASLTGAGYARLREASPTHLRGVARHFLDRLPDEDLAALERIWERLEDSYAMESDPSASPRRRR